MVWWGLGLGRRILLWIEMAGLRTEYADFHFFTINLNNANPQIPSTDYIGSTSCKSRKSAEEWTLQFRDVPEVNGRTVTSRQMFDLDFKSGDALAFMSALGYSWVIYPLCARYIVVCYIITRTRPLKLLILPSVKHPAISSPVTALATYPHLSSFTTP